MYPRNLDNAYAYESERRKDEMRAAAQSRLVQEAVRGRKPSARPTVMLSILALLLAFIINAFLCLPNLLSSHGLNRRIPPVQPQRMVIVSSLYEA